MSPHEVPLSTGCAVTVIIPTFNESKHIGRTLEALCAQTMASADFEVIVIDNGSTDATIAIADAFKERLRLRVMRKAGCHISAVRNFGAAQARGQTLAFLDADCIPMQDWLERSVSVGQARTAWGAHYLVPLDATWVGRVWFEYQARAHEGPTTFLPGGDLFMQKTDFLQLGGFGEEIDTSEDVELCQRARKAGMSVVAFPALAVYHEGTPRTLRHFYRQNRWHGTTVLRIFFANLPSTANLPLVFLSLYTLLLFWLCSILLLTLPWLHHVDAALIAFVLLLLPAALLTATKAFRSSKWSDAAYLFILYMTYLLARAASIPNLSKRSHR